MVWVGSRSHHQGFLCRGHAAGDSLPEGVGQVLGWCAEGRCLRGGTVRPPRDTGLVVCIPDAARPDHMGCYGYPRGEPTRPISAFTETVDLMPTMLEQPEVEGELRALGYLN